MEKSDMNSLHGFRQKLPGATALDGLYPYLDTVSEMGVIKMADSKMPLTPVGWTGNGS